MEHLGNEIEELQKVIGAGDTEAAAAGGMSTNTYRRAKEGKAPDSTQMAALRGLEALRVKRLQRLSNFKSKASA
jgi:hypothetical protein